MSRGLKLAPPRIEGLASRQAHTDLPEGTYERELGREGFFGPATQMHHRHPPTAWTDIEGPLRPRAFNVNLVNRTSDSPWDAQPLLGNAHVRAWLWRAAGAMSGLARDADGDLLLFVHEGGGALYCDYGHLEFRDGDYIVLPRGTMWRIEPSAPVTALMIEATNDAFTLPERGMVGQHAVFDPATLDVPEIDEAFRAQRSDGEWRVAVKSRGRVSTLTYPFNPLDAIGWHGDLMPVRLNWRDIRPLLSARYHLPPSAHTTFLAQRFVICTFAPRPYESDPGALRVPFFHNNDDYDEVLFYHAGDYFGRDGIGPGWITLHPAGITHGPQPNAFKRNQEKTQGEHDGVAVMLDARDALDVAELPEGVEWADYVNSWKGYLA